MGDGGAHSLLRFTLRSLRQERRPSPLYSDISALFSEIAGWGYSSQIETARYLIPVAARPHLVGLTSHESPVTLLSRNQQVLRKRPLAVDPLPIAPESRARRELWNFAGLVLVRAFRPDRFVFVQHEPQTGRRNVHRLPAR